MLLFSHHCFCGHCYPAFPASPDFSFSFSCFNFAFSASNCLIRSTALTHSCQSTSALSISTASAPAVLSSSRSFQILLPARKTDRVSALLLFISLFSKLGLAEPSRTQSEQTTCG